MIATLQELGVIAVDAVAVLGFVTALAVCFKKLVELF
jgi:hypothetical protein